MQKGDAREIAAVRADDVQIVRDLPLFAGISDRQFAALIEPAFLQRFPAHSQLIHEGEKADFLHVVVDGMVEMFATSAGDETTIGFLSPVSTFILAAVLVDKVYLQSARTLEASRILMIPAEAIRSVFVQDVAFAAAVVRELAERYREVVGQLKDHKMRSGIERLSDWILVHAERTPHGATLRIPYEKAKLASYLGMTRESLSRGFAALSDHGVIVRGRVIVCSNLDLLVRWANG
jgi:CRP/FNR family transcriptional activator FtrB